MRTEPEMLDLIFQTAKVLQVDAVAMSGSRTNPKAPKDEFQDYDVVYIVEDLDGLIADLSWLDQFGTRIIEQHNILGNRRLYLMLFEDGNRIDLTICPKDYINEWVDSEAGFTVLVDEKGLFESYSPSPERFWIHPATELKGKAPSQNKTVRLKLQEIYDFLVDYTAIGAYAYPERTHMVNLRDHLNTIRSRYKKRKPPKKAREEATESN